MQTIQVSTPQKVCFVLILLICVATYFLKGELYPLPFGPGFPGKFFSNENSWQYHPRIEFLDSNNQKILATNPVSYLVSGGWGLHLIFLKIFPIPSPLSKKSVAPWPWSSSEAWGRQLHVLRSHRDESNNQGKFLAFLCTSVAPKGTARVVVSWDVSDWSKSPVFLRRIFELAQDCAR